MRNYVALDLEKAKEPVTALSICVPHVGVHKDTGVVEVFIPLLENVIFFNKGGIEHATTHEFVLHAYTNIRKMLPTETVTFAGTKND